ncbi:hypothetical protein [Helicobacter sp. MIT 14-3879]|uniref:hypothetical protein n=1 Tax=Helicobacter sp. MIT 14-3879 TaxID=2040649 RepID=UPI000E1E84AA|nr:hypothetical protein [Helicobacter sp. MIT 14-3879]RDU64705.1 hypothetical protein CQA44_03050 [Helicobacter sp. MIT 14-3879]
MLFKTLKIILESNYLSILLITILLLSPAFITSFLRLFVPEKFESVFFGIFIFAYLYFIKNNKNIYFILALLSGNIALYYKEVAFIMLGSFAFFNFIFSFRISNLKQKLLDLSLMLSSLMWIIIYYVIIILNKTTSGSYGDTPYNKLIVFIKNVMNYILIEPFLIIGVFGILAYRIYLITFRDNKINPFLDSALLASFLHILSYFILNIYSFHYLLPTYIFAIFPLGYYFRSYFRVIFIKIIFIISLILYLLNSIPAFLYQLNHYKAVPNNFQESIAFLDNYLKNNPNTTIYLEGVNRASNIEVYHSFIKNLEFLGHNNFDMKSDIGIDNEILGKENKDCKYSVFKSNAIIPKSSGDLVILTPYTSKPFKENNNYEKIFEATNGFNLPLLGIKSLIKLALSKIIKDNNEIVLSNNIYSLPIHFSIYRVKDSGGYN